MKCKKLLLLISLIPLISCSKNTAIESRVFYFDTLIDIKLYEGNRYYVEFAKSTLRTIDELADNYHERSGVNVYSINHTHNETEVEYYLVDLLKKSLSVKEMGATYFNPLCGSLSQLWKDKLANKELPSEEAINVELNKINTSSLTFVNEETVQRIGEATIDLGGIAKGYALDVIHDAYEQNNIHKYLINAGSSSILLGRKDTNNGYFNVGINDIPRAYLKLKDCFVSTSGTSVQGVTINGITYSHIVNPITGSAINNYDAVIVVSEKGYLGDALSTSMMMNTLEEIQALENTLDVKTIVIKDGQKLYSHPDLKIYYH